LVLGHHQASVPSMVGAIRVSKARDGNTWERHDHGDEVLVVLSGAATMTLRDAEGRTTEWPLSTGDVLVIPRGVAHHATLHTDEGPGPVRRPPDRHGGVVGGQPDRGDRPMTVDLAHTSRASEPVTTGRASDLMLALMRYKLWADAELMGAVLALPALATAP